MNDQLLLGIDLGTSSLKAAVFRAESGSMISSAAAEYPVRYPQPSFAEQDAQDWWRAAGQAVRACMAGISPLDIAAIGLSGQMHGLICLDQAGQPLLPAIIWADGRAAAELPSLEHLQQNSSALLPGPPAAGFAAASALWLKRRRPEILDQTRTILSPKDYVRFRLGGRLSSEPSDASATWLYDLRTDGWAGDVVQYCGLKPDQMPQVLSSSAVFAYLSDEAARYLGLQAGIPIAGGSADVAAQALGHGIVDAGQVLVTLGTGGQVLRPLLEPQVDEHGRLHIFRHNLPHHFYGLAAILSAGLSLRWLRDTLGLAGRKDAYEHLSSLAAQVSPGADGLIFLPYLAGERSPHMDPLAGGLFLGLRLDHGPGHLARAVMEGVGFALKECLELLGGDTITLSGGVTKSAAWPHILAAVFQRPLHMAQEEIPRACWGAAVLAGVSVGLYQDARQGSAVRREKMRTVEPQHASIYQERFEQYRRLYPLLKNEMHLLNDQKGRDGAE